jgi:hypothetical protein
MVAVISRNAPAEALTAHGARAGVEVQVVSADITSDLDRTAVATKE